MLGCFDPDPPTGACVCLVVDGVIEPEVDVLVWVRNVVGAVDELEEKLGEELAVEDVDVEETAVLDVEEPVVD